MPRSYLLSLLLLVLGAASAAAQPQSLAPRSLTRTEDTVVVEGEHIGPKLLGSHKSRLRLYACRAGYMVPIQLQIDERNPEGTYCWDRGQKDRRIQDKDRGRLDGNDQVVFLAREAGDRASPTSFHMVPAHDAVQELEVTDPLDGKKAWVYLFRFGNGPVMPRPATDVTFLRVRSHEGGEKTHYWGGEYFIFNNDRSRKNAARATFAGLVKPGTRDFRGVPNMLDSTQVRAVVSFMWITITRYSPEFQLEIGGYIDGPLRVITENLLSVYLALGMWVDAPESYIILWRNKVSMPTNANNPVNLDESDDSSYSLCVDLTKRVKGWKFFNSHNPKPVDIDGRWSEAEKKLDFTYPDWNAVCGPQGGMISKFVIPEFLKKGGSRLLYVDDLNHEREDDTEGIEFEPGAYGYHGYLMDMRGLKKGLYPGDYLVWYAAPPFGPGDERKYLNEHDHPLQVRATATAE